MTSESILRPARPRREMMTGPARSGAVTVWAAIALVWLVIAVQALLRWIASDDFGPAPLIGTDRMPVWNLVALRVFEGISTTLLAFLVWFCVIKPWRRTGVLSLDGKFVIGGLAAFVADAFLNCYTYLFAWNAHNVNLGVWTAFLPFHNPAASSRYGESLLWGPPMYVYFCAGVAIVGCYAYSALRSRWARLSNVSLFAIVFLGEFVFDFVVENLAIRLTHGYAYARTYGPLTLWAGSQFQFPLYESFLVAALGLFYTWMRLQSIWSTDGLSPVERGFERWHPALQPTVRTLAAIGFCCAATILIYHLPFNWLGIVGASTAHLPTYMWPG
ncbi:spirocyclase AveC family protein [Mycobacterium sp. SMC-2]|uniref:spirocyclase AveC family protein n=1 Tax=Mycobacterium sp. SMC-2 TaxID=2857058 RepID=UPI0021B4549A|nr:spirocyclase AveC family protein [Mycobacterium sp. SMC-2]UXA05909.1 spirocyclase AveC family protein [Mycobacterium sp. SMC-2]